VRIVRFSGLAWTLGVQEIELEGGCSLVLAKGTRASIFSLVIFAWDDAKNEFLKAERGISFERIIVAIESGDTLAVLEHPRPDVHPRRRLYVVEIDGYAWVVPFRDEREERVLITACPSRKFTGRYLKGDQRP
jgi:hypothetical protein